MPKPFNSILLVARVQACLEKKRLHDAVERVQKSLEDCQSKLSSVETEVKNHIHGLLPSSLTGEVSVDWFYSSNSGLKGTLFRYFWVNENQFVSYFIESKGEGVSAALHAARIAQALDFESLHGCNGIQPAAVLAQVQQLLSTQGNSELGSEIWYGVFDRPSRQLTYAVVGQPHYHLFVNPSRVPKQPLKERTKVKAVTAFTNQTEVLPSPSMVLLFDEEQAERVGPDGSFQSEVCLVKFLY